MIHSYTPPGSSDPFTSGIIEKSPNWRTGQSPWLEFTNFRILYLREGRGRVTTPEGSVLPLLPGSLLIRRADWPHRINRSLRWNEFFFTAPAPVGPFLESCGLLRKDLLFNPGVDPGLSRLCEEVDRSIMKRESAHRIIGNLSHLMGEFMALSTEGSGGGRHRRLTPAVEMLEDQRYFLHGLPEIAEKCGLTYENFRKLFKREYGQSPGEYRIRVRMELARDLLNQRELTVSDVAEKLHYSDPFSFSRQFHRWMGVSPREYRSNLWV